MKDRERFWATVFIWIGYAIMLSTTLTSVTGPISRIPGDMVLGVVLVVSLAAAASTAAVWGAFQGRGTAGQGTEAAQQVRKSKHLDRTRISRLVEQLDDDEIIELESLLLARTDSESGFES